MKIMIMKCSVKKAWWEKEIGKMYTVIKEFKEEYLLKHKGSTNERNHILKSDCEVIEK